jgi:hypothetical protein
MAPATEQPELPLLSVELPGPPRRRCALIELPEHSWGRPRDGSTEQRWFYRMYGGDRALRPAVQWQRKGQSLVSLLESPENIRIETTATLQDDGIAITHRLHNRGKVDYQEVQAPTCIKLYAPFNDVFLERTYVHHPEGLELLATETPERLQMNAEEWLPARYIVRCVPPPPSPDQRAQRGADKITRYQKRRLADAPFMATTSSPAGWVAASHTLATSSMFTNPARTCHHVDPSAPLKPGGTAVLSLKLYLLRGTADDAWKVVRRSRKQGRA